MFEIEKNIPIPVPYRKRKEFYPFSEMDVGDSFFVENGRKDVSCNPYTAMINRNSRHNKDASLPKFYAEWVDNGIRIWRVK